MKRMLTYALGAVLAASALPAFSQDNFPDTPENHWAYEALARMRAAGLLVGYPDGLFRGARPASRYEMAVALHALYQHLKGLSDGLEAQHNALKARVDELDRRVAAGTGQVTRDDLRQLQEALATTRSAIDGMKAWGDDIAALKRMSSTFERELASMGVDVEALKKGVNDLAARVEALEKRKLPVDIHGDLNLLLLGGMSDSPDFGITVDGRPTGVARDGSGDAVGFTHDLTILHEAAVTLSGTNDTGPKWKGTMVIGNTLMDSFQFLSGFGPSGFAFGNMSEVLPGIPFGEPSTDVWIHELAVTFATSLFGLGFDAEIGRVGLHLNPYTFMRPDNTPYYKNARWDDGRWIFDGGIFKFNLGCSKLTMFGGRQSNRTTTNGVEINPMSAGQAGHIYDPLTFGLDERPRGFAFNNGIFVDQHLGFNVEVPIANRAKLNVNYLFLDSNNTSFLGNSMFANRAIVFGGDLSFMLNDQISLFGGFSQSNLQLDGDDVIDEDNRAVWGGISYKANRWGAKLAYRAIDPQFAAPGWWGRIGIWWNPTNIQGFMGSVDFDLSDNLGLHVSGGAYTGREIDLNGVEGLTKDDKVNHVNVKLNYKLNPSWNVMLGAEMVNWDLEDRILPQGGGFSGGKPTERWYTLGLRYNMSDNAWMSFMWQISDYDSDSVSGWNPFGFSSSEKAKGGLITTQLGIKF